MQNKEWFKKEYPSQLSFSNIIEQIRCEASIKYNRSFNICIDYTKNIVVTIPSTLTHINWAPGCGEAVETLGTISNDKNLNSGIVYDKEQGLQKIVEHLRQLLEEEF